MKSGPWPGRVAALVSAALVAGAVQAEPPVWIVKGRHGQALLFGSVHLLPPGLAWRPEVLDKALAKADTLWFELPITQDTDLQAVNLIQTRGAAPPGEPLSALLTPDQKARLARAAAKVDASPAALEGMRPWMADLTLSLLQDGQAGARASQGVEQSLQNMAPPKIRRRAFETPADQISVLADAATVDQVASLDETLTDIVERPDMYRHVVDEWMAGDLDGLEADALTPLRKVSPALYDRLITQRNQSWAKIIAAAVGHKGSSVVVVGAGHLVGPGGVPALLRAAGLKVEGPLPAMASTSGNNRRAGD